MFLLDGDSELAALASHWRRKGRDLSVAASESEKARIGGPVSSAKKTRKVPSIVKMNSNVAPIKRSAVIRGGHEESLSDVTAKEVYVVAP